MEPLMTSRKLYYLTDDGMAKLKMSPAFIRLTLDHQETLEEYLQTALSGMNRVDKKLLRFRLGRILDIVGPDADKRLLAEIWNVLCFQKTLAMDGE